MARRQGSPHLWALLFAALCACQPGGLRTETGSACFPDRPEPGQIRVGLAACPEMGLSRGAADTGDFWLANHRFRVVLRHPQASLTLVGAGGGTVIDGGPWGQPDTLHEVAPLVGGGWLDVDRAEVLEDGVLLSGTVVSLPDRPAERAGSRAQVSWRVAPDDPWLRVEGADGLWLHASGTFERLDDWLWSGQVVFGHDGDEVEDLGGALRVQGASRLFLGTPREALRELSGERPLQLSGVAPGAERIELARNGAVFGWVGAAADGSFGALVPSDVGAVRGVASGRAASAPVLPGSDLELTLGEPGSFEIRPAWSDGIGDGLRIAWSAADGRTGLAHLPAAGGTLFLGAGAYELDVSAGPVWQAKHLSIETGSQGVPLVGFAMARRFDPGDRVLGAIGIPPDRSRHWRGSDPALATAVAGLGARWMVFAPEDDVSSVSDISTAFPAIPHRDGSRTVALDGSWSIVSWPWSANGERPGHGAVDARFLTPEDALAAAVGGLTRDRHTVVDRGWLEAAPAPWAVSPAPEGVFLEPPGIEGPHEAWSAWFSWLDSGSPLTPVGPLAWFPVADPGALANEDLEQAFTAGRSVATTGPLLDLTLGDAGPGDISEGWQGQRVVEGWVGGAQDLDHLALIGDGGTVLRQWTLPGLEDELTVHAVVHPERWLVLAGWNDAGTAFAVTSPLWTDPP